MSTELYQLIAEAVTPVGKDSEQLPGRFVQKEDDVYASFKSDSEKPDNEEKVKNFQKKVSKLKEAFEYLDEEELEVIADTIVELMDQLDESAHSFKSHVEQAVKYHNEGNEDLAKVHTNKAFYAAAESKGADEFKLHGTPHYKKFQELRKIYQ